MIINEPFLRTRTPLTHAQYQTREARILNENIAIYKKANKYDVFLSHSYLDKTLIYTLVELFNDAGYSVYVDWMVDTQLDRTNVNVSTAAQLRERMQSCKSLAYIATTNISQSKWCPWELGYVDGQKNGRCAILPILKTDAVGFKGQEYLGLYPYIDYVTKRNSNDYDFWVNDPKDNNKYVSLREWLLGKSPYNHE